MSTWEPIAESPASRDVVQKIWKAIRALSSKNGQATKQRLLRYLSSTFSIEEDVAEMELFLATSEGLVKPVCNKAKRILAFTLPDKTELVDEDAGSGSPKQGSEPEPKGTPKAVNTANPITITDDEKEDKGDNAVNFEVDEILNWDGDDNYFVSWKGYPSEDNTWETAENLERPDLIEAYHEKRERDGTGKKSSKSEKEMYVVDKILAKAQYNGGPHYLVSWQGFGSDQNSWEPVGNLNCPDLIQAFEASKQTSQTEKSGTKRKHAGPSIPESNNAATRPEKIIRGGQEYFVVEKIVGDKKIKGQLNYRVKWKGYPSKQNTWEPAKNLICPDLMVAYHTEKREKESASKKKTPKFVLKIKSPQPPTLKRASSPCSVVSESFSESPAGSDSDSPLASKKKRRRR